MSKKSLRVVLFINAVLLSPLQIASAQGDGGHVLMLDYSNQQPVYTIDGRAPGSQEGLLRALGRTRAADHRENTELQILVSESARLSELGNLIGIALKAEYTNYRLFVFDAGRTRMSEIKYGQSLPFSPTGRTHGT